MNSTMPTARSPRRRLRAAVLGATVAAALLTVTACQSDDDGDAAAPPRPTASATATGAPEPTAPTTDSGTGTGTATPAGTASATETGTGDSGETGGGNGTEHPDCRATDLNTEVELQDPAGETPRHFLLTVTNNTRKPCVLNDAPVLRLKAGNDAPIVETLGEPDTEPVVVEGGGKAYAGLYVFGNDEGGEAEYDQSDRFTATLVAGEGTELAGTLIFDLPDGLDTVSVDDAARLNGWAGTEGLAMRPISLL
ncbi:MULTISPECIES: DUF4232 domain-containing protein [Streptomyces]|uniref:DUF4232 domain-containing protein n=2 Tax=Streptomyces TaxID=1883 RepID=A0ABU4K0S6_9ACTN|nr:DUF4232 domain-containing protein [Streptomyces roseolus]MDX2291077.1 DUF4232 domain-containing protein [Streptomyces roseolus]